MWSLAWLKEPAWTESLIYPINFKGKVRQSCHEVQHQLGAPPSMFMSRPMQRENGRVSPRQLLFVPNPDLCPEIQSCKPCYSGEISTTPPETHAQLASISPHLLRLASPFGMAELQWVHYHLHRHPNQKHGCYSWCLPFICDPSTTKFDVFHYQNSSLHPITSTSVVTP